MRKTAAALAILLFVPLTTALDYEVFLFNNEPEEKFHMEGWITSSGENIDTSLFYNLSFHETNYNKTQIDNLTVILVDGEEKVASNNNKKIGKLKENSSKSGFVSIESSRSPDRVDQVIFLLEHEATASQGYKVKETVRGFFDYEITPVHPEIEYLKTRDSTVKRGEKITVRAKTSSINHLETPNTNFSEMDENLFKANLTLPGTETGESPVYRLKDGRGNTFDVKLNATVVNTPPEIKLVYNTNVTEGEKTRVKVKTSDDTGINSTYVTFRGRRYSGGKVDLLTGNIPSGEHNFRAVAIDDDGANTTATGTLEVPGKERKSDKEEETEENAVQQEDTNEENTEEDESLIQPFMNFLKSLF